MNPSELPEFDDLTPLTFIGTTTRLCSSRTLQLARLCRSSPCYNTGRIFPKTFGSQLGRNPAIGNVFNFDQPALITPLNQQLVTRSHITARFDLMAVQFHFTACHCIPGLDTRFEESRGPKPFIDAAAFAQAPRSGGKPPLNQWPATQRLTHSEPRISCVTGHQQSIDAAHEPGGIRQNSTFGQQGLLKQ